MDFMLIYIFIATLLAALFYTINMAIYRVNRNTLSQSDLITTYECGFETIENQARTEHSISFYLIALLYVIFDLEIALILPALVSLIYLGLTGGTILIMIMTILCLAFVYELQLGTFSFVNPLQ